MTTTDSDAYYRDFVASMTTADLVLLRHAFILDRDDPSAGSDCVAFCTERLRVIDDEFRNREQANERRVQG